MELQPKDKNGKFAPSALSAVGVAGVAIIAGVAIFGAIDQNQQSNQEEQKPSYQNSDGIYSVPDAGSTAALLGLSVALVGLAQRKFAIVK
jgi:hypothetical protein